MLRSARRATLCAVLATVVVSPALDPTQAHAAGTLEPQLGGYSDTVVDQVHGQVFVSGPAATLGSSTPGGLVRTTITGGSPQLVPAVTATGPLALSPDSSTLFVLGTHGVEAIDTTTYAVTEFPVTDVGCLHDIAATTGHVWFSYSCDSSGQSGDVDVAALDLADGTVTTGRLAAPVDGWVSLASAPAAADRVAVLTLSAGDTRVALGTASGSTLDLGPVADAGTIYGTALALSADGSLLLTGGTGVVDEYDTATMTRQRSISLDTPNSAQGQPTNGSAQSVAFSPDGTAFAVTGGFGETRGSTSYAYGAVVQTYRQATGALVRQYDYRDFYTDQNVVNVPDAHSLAWAGGTLWATFVNYLGERPTTHLLDDALLSPTTVGLQGPRTATRGRALALTGTVADHGVPLGGVALPVTRTDLDGTHRLGTVTADAHGAFTVRDTPGVGGTVTYRVSYAGDATHAAAARTAGVAVSRATPALTVTTDRSRYLSGHRAVVTAHLGATYRNRVVSIAMAQYPGPFRLVRTAKVGAHGTLSVSVVVTSRASFRVSFGGDERYGPRSTAVARQVAGTVSTSLHGAFRHSGGYAVFHASTGGTIDATVHPASILRYVGAQLQVHYHGKWQQLAADSIATDAKGRATFGFAARPGYDYRIRAVTGPAYVGSTVVLTSGSGTWYYVRFN